jgi:hypothetical protein
MGDNNDRLADSHKFYGNSPLNAAACGQFQKHSILHNCRKAGIGSGYAPSDRRRHLHLSLRSG